MSKQLVRVGILTN